MVRREAVGSRITSDSPVNAFVQDLPGPSSHKVVAMLTPLDLQGCSQIAQGHVGILTCSGGKVKLPSEKNSIRLPLDWTWWVQVCVSCIRYPVSRFKPQKKAGCVLS